MIKLLQAGDILGNRYVVDSLIAKGGMGNVYLVKDTKLNHQLWAVKELTDVASHAQFVEEARILTSLSHPYIPKVTDYFEPGPSGSCYLVMEYINGNTLQQLFEKSGMKFPWSKIKKYILQICDILSYLHGQPQPIVFRDLKPANIMIDEFDNVRLIDFGIARNYEQHKLNDTVQMGTIAFAAPEQFERQQTDPRTDIYSLGTVMYYLLTNGGYFFQSYHKLEEMLAEYPKAILQVMRKLLAPNPDDRFQQMREAADAIRDITTETASLEQRSTQEESDGHAALPINPSASERFATQRMDTVKITPGGISEPRLNTQARSSRVEISYAPYTTQATQSHPALIIYLLDASGSMNVMAGEKKRLDVVMEALHAALKQMVFRSTKGSRISSRYRVAILAYSDEVHDMLGGIKSIDELMNTGMMPTLTTGRFTDTAKAFLQAEQILKQELPQMRNSPAPLICHMTDGVYTGQDPEPIVHRIRNMSVKDGQVLVENIFVSDELLEREITNPMRWQGIQADTMFRDDYGYKLRAMSSIIPESYRQMMQDVNYNLAEGSFLMFPGTHSDLVSLGFQMSAATPIR